MKTIKIIDLLNKIANGENAPNTIRINGFSFIFNSYTSIDCYYTEEISNKFWLSFMSIDLTDEVEILDEEDEFEDIEEITCEGKKIELGSLNKWLASTMNDNECKMCSAIECLGMELNRVIKNQKKIIDKLKNE